LLEQYQYLYDLTPKQELKEALQEVKNQVAFLNSTKFNSNSLKTNLPLNLSANYWKSILDYKPLEDIKEVKIPILILQGERDYQVTMIDFNLWKKALKNNPNAYFISYPKLNHIFISGDNISKPDEYSVKGNVEEKAINDIFTFIVK